MECPFCQIDGEKTRIIEEKRLTMVVLSNPRLMPGHTLVIPKRHCEKLTELTREERVELFDTIIEFQAKILERYAKGCDIRQNLRPFLPQSRLKIDHVHFPLQPREFKDELYERCQQYETALFQDLTDDEREKFVRLFADRFYP